MASNTSNDRMRSSNARWADSLIRRMPGVSRRGWLAGVGAFLALLTRRRTLADPQASQHSFGVGPDLDNGTKLYLTNPDGTNKSPLGYVIACPQKCLAMVPGSSNVNCKIYKTPETMREIIFYDSTQFDRSTALNARSKLPAARLKDESGTRGCGYVSKSVAVTQIVNAGTLNQIEQPYPGPGVNANLFYAITANGVTNPTPPPIFCASEIWISASEWTPDAQGQNAISKILANIPSSAWPVPSDSPCAPVCK